MFMGLADENVGEAQLAWDRKPKLVWLVHYMKTIVWRRIGIKTNKYNDSLTEQSMLFRLFDS